MESKLGAKVLYLGDDPSGHKVLEIILGQERNDKVTYMPDYEQIKAVIEQETPDLIILNVFTLNELWLDEAYQHLKTNLVLQNVPILLWRVVNQIIYREAQRLGMAGCIGYNFSRKELLAARDTVLAGDTYYPLLD